MNNELLNKSLYPATVITVFKGRREYTSDYYLEQRDIRIVNGKPALMAAHALSEETMREISRSFIKRQGIEMKHAGIIPEHILHASTADGILIIWYRPAEKKAINFSRQLGIKGSSTVTIPACLYMIKGREMYVYALESNARPTVKTKLFNAPFFNVYEDGRICLGTAPISSTRAETYEEEIERYERGFWLAEQNGGDHGERCKSSSLTKMWNECIKAGGVFPGKKELVQVAKIKTLGDLISKKTQLDLDEE